MYEPKEGATAQLDFHWYIVLLGGGFVLYNLVCIVIEIVKRIFNIIILYIGSPFAISKMVLDDGKSFKEWQAKFFYEFTLFLAQMGTFMIFVALINVLNNIDFEALASSGDSTGDDMLIDPGIVEPEPDASEPVVETTYSLLNGVGRTLIIMAAVSVTRSSATMLATLLSSKESKTENLLESVLTKISTRGMQPSARTRTITKNTTTTKRETVFVEAVGANSSRGEGAHSSGGRSSGLGGTGNVTINQNVNVSNKFTSNNSITNRDSREGIQKGSYGSEKLAPGNVYINATRSIEPAGSKETFKFMDEATSKAATNIVKEYGKASSGLTNAINSGDNTILQKSIAEYTKAYSKEAEILSDNYRKFETKASASMKSEISAQTKQELKNITNAYRKAQMDYNRTATKLNQYAGERMSTAEALKMKERADKQRETLMSASKERGIGYGILDT